MTVNPSQTYQTMDGFGAFGAMNVWWSNGPFWNDAFLKLVFDTIGLTTIRTELYPQPDQTDMWTKQIPYLKAVNAYVTANKIPFKFFASIWSPPGSMKTGGSATGGQVMSSKYAAYGQYVVDYIKRFKTDVGADLYAVSAQNEPALCTGYNSSCYLPSELTPVLTGVADAMAASGLSTFLHWPDNVWWGGIWEDFSGATKSANLVKVGKIMSWHYGDDDVTKEKNELALLQNEATGGTNKFRMWNTEFGGYFDNWNGEQNDENGNPTGDAWVMAKTMHLNMQYGFNAIVWWQLAEPRQTDPASRHYGMLLDAKLGPRGVVMQNFARYIRPGAVRLGCTSSDANVWSVAFKHDGDKTYTVLLLNNGSAATTATVSGTGLPASLDAYQTSPTQNCAKIGSFAPGASINLPVKSITTLYNPPSVGTQMAPNASAQAKQSPAVTAGRTSVYAINGTRLNASAHRPAGICYMQGTGRQDAVMVAKNR